LVRLSSLQTDNHQLLKMSWQRAEVEVLSIKLQRPIALELRVEVVPHTQRPGRIPSGGSLWMTVIQTVLETLAALEEIPPSPSAAEAEEPVSLVRMPLLPTPINTA
jgi:hypothetical protein